MTHLQEILQKDHAYIWHPCSQMKDYESFKPLLVEKAQGSHFYLSDGSKIIDAISSWWCKSLGHGHPQLKQALLSQLEKFEHVIFANTTNETIIQLSEKLCHLTQSLNKVFYAGDGSSAVEIALKMSLHARKIRGEQHKTKFVALQNGYHGETFGTLSVSDVGLYREPYQSQLFDCGLINDIPYVTNITSSLWQDSSSHWNNMVKKLEAYKYDTTAVIVEPIVQGAGGMKIYSADFLRKLRQWCSEHHIHLIADEIMTGLGRTSKMLACEHAGIEADFVCLSKGLTAGWLPFSAVLTRDDIYALFYDDYETHKGFLHSHTHSGNVLGAALALAALEVLEQEKLCERAAQIGTIMQANLHHIANQTGCLTNVRGIGCLAAADLISIKGKDRLGYQIFQRATALGAYLRPLGNTIYWLPPLNIPLNTLTELMEITEAAIIDCI